MRTWWGFQSLSKMTTVSAAWRFKPRPPARVLSKKMKYWDPGSLNFFSKAARSSDLVVPEGIRKINLPINSSPEKAENETKMPASLRNTRTVLSSTGEVMVGVCVVWEGTWSMFAIRIKKKKIGRECFNVSDQTPLQFHKFYNILSLTSNENIPWTYVWT